MSLNKYDPRLKKYQELKSTFICGRNIYEEIMEDLVPSPKGKTARQSWIITGPRGAGKSHLITHLYREITVDKKLSQTWIPLIFPEEIFKVDSLYRLMIVVFDKLIKEIEPSNEAADVIAQFGVLKKTRIKGGLIQKREQRREDAKELLSLLGQMVQHTGKKLMLLLENLQYLFRDQIPEIDQKVLRSFLHEQPDVLIIVGTALTVFNEVENYGLPFYHFFRIRGMEPLTKEGIEAFLNKIAEFRGDDNIAAKIEANRHHIHTYSILTGGNPRLILFLYELLLDHQLLNTSLILDKVAELTPYFLDKTRDESLQRKLILDSLATGPPAKTATEIADEVNEDQKSITEQLKRLTAESWIHALPIQGDDVKKKEVFYSLRDYFFRIWYQVRMGDIDESEVFCLAELVTLLFDKEQIHERINCNLDTPGYRIDIKPDAVESWTRLGYSQYELNRHKKALESFQKALDVDNLTYILTHTYDLIIGAFFLLFVMSIGQRVLLRFLPKYKPFSKTSANEIQEVESSEEQSFFYIMKKTFVLPLLAALGIAIVIIGISVGVGELIPKDFQMMVIILTITTLSILASLIKRINRIQKTFDVGMYFILVFSLVVASMADLRSFSSSHLHIFYWVFLVYAGSLIIHVALAALFKIDADNVIIVSTALTCSPPFVPVVAGALKNKEIIISGITVGIIGYAIGNYLGVFIAYLFKSLPL